MTILPPEVLYPILNTHIRRPSTTIHAALSLRLLSKAINAEVLHQLFTLGELDAKFEEKRYSAHYLSNVCQLCRAPIRPERRGRAINRVTMQRYLVTWLERTCERSDLRFNLWRRLRHAIELFEGTVRAMSLDSLVESDSEGRTNETRSKLVDAIITMFGVRDTWAYLGPHHDTCKPNGAQFPDTWNDNRAEAFWCVIIAAYGGSLDMVRHFLNDLGISSTGEWAKAAAMSRLAAKNNEMLDNWWGRSATVSQWTRQTDCLAAAITIAIRLGHEKMVSFLLEIGMAKTVCCETPFWNGRTVMGTLFAATADRNPRIAQTAVKTIQRIVGEWRESRLWIKDRRWYVEHLRWALDIPTKSAILLEVLLALLPSYCNDSADKAIAIRLLHLLLCQAAMANDIERAKLAIKTTSFHAGEVSMSFQNWSRDEGYILNPHADTDEYGVRCDRLMDVLNPIRIAAALSHSQFLDWVLAPEQWVKVEVSPWRLKAKTWTEARELEKEAKRVSEYSLLLDARREAVNDVFLNEGRLPFCVQPKLNVKTLELILRRSGEMHWANETIVSAGTKENEIFKTFVDFTDLGTEAPQKIHRMKGRLFVEGAYARTVGERSLQHALKAGRVDNAETLLERGVKLAEAVRSDGFFDDDPEAMAMLKGLQEMKLPGVTVVARTMKVLYWVDGGVQPKLKQTRAIEEDDKKFVWKGGQKMKRVGAPTFLVL